MCYILWYCQIMSKYKMSINVSECHGAGDLFSENDSLHAPAGLSSQSKCQAVLLIKGGGLSIEVP